jgi:outer membrane protein
MLQRLIRFINTTKGEYLMKNLLFAFLSIMLLTAGQAIAAPPVKIAVVDLQKAVSECREGVAARAAVLKKADELAAGLKKMAADLEKAKTDLEKGSAKLSQEVRNDKEKQLQKQAREFQNRQQEAQEELKQVEAESLKKLVTRLGAIMGKMGDEGGYAAILDKRVGVFYTNKEIDLTAQLISKADMENGK